LLTCLAGCTEDEFTGYDTPFISISTSTGASSTVVLSNVKNINEYTVKVSSRLLTEQLTVNYEVIVGDGLQEGVDYKLLTTGNTLTFEPGVYDMPIRIQWLAHEVDSSKDNTLTIRLTGNSMGMNLGLPGPDGSQKEVVIEKQN